MEVLAHVSRTLSEHRTLDDCICPVPSADAVGSFRWETAHVVSADGTGFEVCVRFLRAWHHGEALHAPFLELSLAKVCPPDAARCVCVMLYRQCCDAECSCGRVVARWKTGFAL